MARIVKATEEQKRAYHGVYSLFGYVKVDGQLCAIEFPNEGEGNPKYEVMAPAGFHFAEGPHSLVCCNQDDIQTRIAGGLEKCTEKCEEPNG